MYRRDAGGRVRELHVNGIWGNGNTVGDLAERFGDADSWSMWDGRPLAGSARIADTWLEKFPALVARISAETFLARYADLGEDCQMLVGEVLGEGCDAACTSAANACNQAVVSCADACPGWPRALTSCVAQAGDCGELAACGATRWESR